MITTKQFIQDVENLFNHFQNVGLNKFVNLISGISTDEIVYININRRNLELLDEFSKNIQANKYSLRNTRVMLYKLIAIGDPDINENFEDIQYLISSLDNTKAEFEEKLDYYDNILYIIESLPKFKSEINKLLKIKDDFNVELSVYSKLKYLENINDVLKVLHISEELFELFVELKFKYVVLQEELSSLIGVKDDILKLKSKI